jgi:hypothetical protein
MARRARGRWYFAISGRQLRLSVTSLRATWVIQTPGLTRDGVTSSAEKRGARGDPVALVKDVATHEMCAITHIAVNAREHLMSDCGSRMAAACYGSARQIDHLVNKQHMHKARSELAQCS